MVFTEADYNRLYNYKITKFTVSVKSCSGGAKVVVAVVVRVLRLSFKCLKGWEGAIKIEHMHTRGDGEGDKFWAFCDNMIIKYSMGERNKRCEIQCPWHNESHHVIPQTNNYCRQITDHREKMCGWCNWSFVIENKGSLIEWMTVSGIAN